MRDRPIVGDIIIFLVLGLAVSACHSRPAAPQVYRLAELNTDQIRALDRAKTLILLPGGILEEHGPYLPSYTDGYLNERLKVFSLPACPL
jgi:hypothetical protein